MLGANGLIMTSVASSKNSGQVTSLRLGPTIVAMRGALCALVSISRRRALVGAGVLITVEALRLWWLIGALPPPPGTPQIGSGFVVIHILATALMLLGGYVIAQTLRQWLPWRKGAGLKNQLGLLASMELH